MTTTGIREGDLVYIEKKQGWKFMATVTGRDGKDVLIEPFSGVGPQATYRSVTAREIKKHWKLMGRKD